MHEQCEKYEEWSNGYIALMLSLVAAWLVTGLWVISTYSVLHTILYGIVFMATNFITPYAFCRRCYYYGKKCYLLGGLLVPRLFDKVEEPVPPLGMAMETIHIFIKMGYPLYFIFMHNNLIQFIIFLIAPVTMGVLIYRHSCPHCKQTSCRLNPDRINT